jgi:hypothetical protein
VLDAGAVVNVPDKPPATYTLLPNARARMLVVPKPDVRVVHVTPSVDVVNVPPVPQATYTPLPKPRAKMDVVPKPDVRVVHVVPSVDVRN